MLLDQVGAITFKLFLIIDLFKYNQLLLNKPGLP